MLRWLKRRSDTSPASTAGQDEADKALEKADASLRRAEGETSEILQTAEHLKRLGRQNDFAARISKALGGT